MTATLHTRELVPSVITGPVPEESKGKVAHGCLVLGLVALLTHGYRRRGIARHDAELPYCRRAFLGVVEFGNGVRTGREVCVTFIFTLFWF